MFHEFVWDVIERGRELHPIESIAHSKRHALKSLDASSVFTKNLENKFLKQRVNDNTVRLLGYDIEVRHVTYLPAGCGDRRMAEAGAASSRSGGGSRV